MMRLSAGTRGRWPALAGVAAAMALSACGAAAAPKAGVHLTSPPAAARGITAPGVGCAAPLPTTQGTPGTPAAMTATLDGFVVELTGLVPPAAEPPGIARPVLHLTVPGGRRFERPLSFLYHDTLLTLPITVGRLQSEMCLVRFGDAPDPTVVFAEWYATAQPYTDVVGIPVGAGGIGQPLRDEPFVTGVALVSSGGRPVILADDARFATHDGWAAHLDPPLVVSTAGGSFVDVTAAHPSLVQRPLQNFWHLWSSARRQYFGAVALTAWTAAECSIGRRASAEAELDSLAARGELEWGGYPVQDGMPWVRGMEATLAGWGYCRT